MPASFIDSSYFQTWMNPAMLMATSTSPIAPGLGGAQLFASTYFQFGSSPFGAGLSPLGGVVSAYSLNTALSLVDGAGSSLGGFAHNRLASSPYGSATMANPALASDPNSVANATYNTTSLGNWLGILRRVNQEYSTVGSGLGSNPSSLLRITNGQIGSSFSNDAPANPDNSSSPDPIPSPDGSAPSDSPRANTSPGTRGGTRHDSTATPRLRPVTPGPRSPFRGSGSSLDDSPPAPPAGRAGSDVRGTDADGAGRCVDEPALRGRLTLGAPRRRAQQPHQRRGRKTGTRRFRRPA